MSDRENPEVRIVVSRPGRARKRWRAVPDVTTWRERVAWLKQGGTGGKYARPHLPVTLRESPGARTNANLDQCYELTLDADHAPPDYIERIESLGYTALSYTTASWTEDEPRWRTHIPLDEPVSPAEKHAFATFLIERIGAEYFDRQASTSPAHVAYAPAWDSVQYVDHTGPVLSVEWLRLVAPEPTWTVKERLSKTLDEWEGEHEVSFDALPACPYGREALRGELERLEGIPEGSGVHTTGLYHAAARAVELVEAGCWSLNDVETLRKTALGMRKDPRPEEFDEALVSALHDGVAAKTGCSEHSPAGPGGGGGGGGGRPAPVTTRMQDYVTANYEVFKSASDERVFMRPMTGGRAELLDGPAILRACRPLALVAATLSAAAVEAAKVLTAYAGDAPTREVALRAHHQPGRVVLDLGRPDGSCVVVTRDGWTVETAPPDDVVFAAWSRADATLALPVRGGCVDELRKLLGWKADDPNWLLVRGWLATALLGSIPRPMVAFLGKAGSGKTTVGRMLMGLLDPKPEGKLGSAFGKNRADDESKALNNFLLAFDNVERVSEEGSNFLARLVTGDLVDKRKLYTEFGVATAAYQRTGVLTAIEMPTGLRADALDRLIPVSVVLPDMRRSEDALWADWSGARGRILGGVLDDLVTVLRGGGGNPDGLRMADYASALSCLGPDVYRAYADNVHDARGVMAAGDPFVQGIVAWLTEVGGEWTGTAEEAVKQGGLWASGWWPDSGRSFGSALAKVGTLLDEIGVVVTEQKPHKGPRQKTLRLLGDVEPESLL